jgi:hypothetical protein
MYCMRCDLVFRVTEVESFTRMDQFRKDFLVTKQGFCGISDVFIEKFHIYVGHGRLNLASMNLSKIGGTASSVARIVRRYI